MPPYAPLTTIDEAPSLEMEEPMTKVVSMQTSSSSYSASRKTKMVTFSPVSKVHEIMHINDLMKTADVDEIWYTEDEYDAFLSDCVETIQNVQMQRPLHDGKQTFRGLEKMISHGCFHKQQVRLYARSAVFEEQEFQRRKGFNDVEFLASVYYDHSMQSHSDAHMIALRDRQEVLLAIWSEYGVPKSMSSQEHSFTSSVVSRKPRSFDDNTRMASVDRAM